VRARRARLVLRARDAFVRRLLSTGPAGKKIRRLRGARDVVKHRIRQIGRGESEKTNPTLRGVPQAVENPAQRAASAVALLACVRGRSANGPSS
jgi:hypothetical protein